MPPPVTRDHRVPLEQQVLRIGYMMFDFPHQYIDRGSSEVVTEKLFADRLVSMIYCGARESSSSLFNALVSQRFSKMLGFLNYDIPLGMRLTSPGKIVHGLGINLGECVEPPEYYTTARRIFERQIKYWTLRPMDSSPDAVVSPADSRILAGSFNETSALFIKDKFFSFEDLLSPDKPKWLSAFAGGDFAVCRLTPDKYHYNHFPVSGKILDIYPIDGACNSCNPAAVVTLATPYSKNKRMVTVIDTDVEGGSRVGLVAMIEVTALMIGDIKQAYSQHGYADPADVCEGLFVEKGRPKSLYRPGSSVDILIFEKDKVCFCDDILANMRRADAKGRFCHGFGQPLVETDVAVRSTIAHVRRR